MFHAIMSFLFFVTAIFHLATHWDWYSGIIKNGMGRKSKVTAVLSVLFLSTSVTGIILLDVNGANPQIGLSHYKIGIAMSLLSIGHILKRLPVLRKSMKIGRL